MKHSLGNFDQIIGIQDEARKILDKLENRNVPPTGLNYFTVGDSFRSNLFSLKEEILELHLAPKSLEKTVIGGFGSGKTHFLTYLNWLLQKDAPKESVISRVDLSDLREINEFEFLVVQGLRPSKGEGNYADVLRQAYQRIRDSYMAKYHNVSKNDIELFYGTIIFSVLGHASQGWVNRDMLDLLGVNDPIDKLLNFISGKTMQSLFEKAQNNANKEHVEFVNKYLSMIRSPDTPISAFEEPARELAHRGRLTDVIFKILSLSGIELIVLLVDELESLSRYDTYDMRKILVSVRDFRDTFRHIGTNPGYPSIAFVTSSTGAFFDKIYEEEPALHSRWEDRIIPLEFMSSADIDNLIFKLRELYYLAGYQLSSVASHNDSISHGVIELREKMLGDFHASETKEMTTRRLLSHLLKDIRTKWVNSP